MKDRLFIGIDFGTTVVKAAAFTGQGVQVAVARRDVHVRREYDGWSELPMDEVWEATQACMHDVVAKVDREAVQSVGVCAQGDGLWMLDANMQPVRNAILWNDARASDYITTWVEDGTSDQISRYCRTAIWPGASGAALRWVQDNEPEAFERIAHILHAKDWIVWKLTGTLGTDFSDATIPFLNLETGAYEPKVFAAMGLPDLTDRLPKPVPATSLAGPLVAGLGLPEVPVARGSSDVASMMIGAGISAPGALCLILGTTAVVTHVIPPEPFTEPPLGATLHHPFTSDWIRGLAPQSGASNLDWFASLHPKSFGGQDAAEVARKINDAAQIVPPGANGVLFLPFLTGERAPFVAPEAAASFHGMRASTTNADLARAVMEGTALSLRHCLHSESIPPPERVVLTGGGARNPLWCQTVADVLGLSVLADASEDHGLWGAALMGGAAAGLLDPLDIRRDDTFDLFEPHAQACETYDAVFDIYLKAIEANRAVWDAMRT